MAHLLLMPAILAGATEAVLLSWHVQPGGSFAEGDALAEIETDKALVELTAEEAGVLGRAVVLDGQRVAVGDPIAVLIAEGDTEADIETALTAGAPEATSASEPSLDAAPPAASDVPELPAPSPSRLFVSPLVRKLAREQEIDLTQLTGTGPGGRIVRRDLEAWVAAGGSGRRPAAASTPPPAPAEVEEIPHTGMRRAIARRLTESKTTVPHFYMTAELRVGRLLDLRAEVNARPGTHVSVNDLLLKAAAAAFERVPEANVVWTDDALRRFPTVDIAVAVATDAGLVTPVVRDIGAQSLTRLSTSVRDLVDRARAGRLHQHELEGGACSISNLGMYGTREFSAILNPPQSSILAIGATRDTVVVDDGTIGTAQVMTVTMSVDHRAVDGALAAQWLAEFGRIVEHPVSMLV